MQTIGLLDVPAQTLRVILAGRSCRITLRQRATGMYLDLYVNDTQIVLGVACRNKVRIVRGRYLKFSGDLAFIDDQGSGMDPSTPGLGTRFLLCYLNATEVPA